MARPRSRRSKTSCEEFATFTGTQLSFHQSNHEGVLVDLIQSARTDADALIINPAAYSFTSIAMYDALKIFEGPIFEVHISNIHARDELHRHSKLSSAVKAVIAGSVPGYIVAMQAALQSAGKLPAALPAAMRLKERFHSLRPESAEVVGGQEYLAVELTTPGRKNCAPWESCRGGGRGPHRPAFQRRSVRHDVVHVSGQFCPGRTILQRHANPLITRLAPSPPSVHAVADPWDWTVRSALPCWRPR